MFIAFEGPDNVGKSTSAANLAADGMEVYNVTKKGHADMVATFGDTLEPVTYDRIDWMTHMVYRLSLPERDWNDERPRTVFAMPDTHLVFKLHHPDYAAGIADELYTTGTLAKVNPMYYYFADFFTGLNEERDYALFKTISVMQVIHDQKTKEFAQQLVSFSSPVIEHIDALHRGVDSDEMLLALLRDDDRQRL